MTVATVTKLPVRRAEPEPVEAAEQGDEWVLPPGAVPIDCVTFGEMHRTIARLTKRVEVLETRAHLAEMRAHRKTEGV